MKKVSIYLENGIFLEARSFGAEGTSTGEIVFNTSMTGYQEIVTDPSYAGQFITFTMPEIGNVGCNMQDMESRGAFCKGILVRQYQHRASSFRCEESLAALLKRYGVMGICDIDTRYLTRTIRAEGAMEMIASTEIDDEKELARILSSSPRIEEINYIEQVSTKEAYVHKEGKYDARSFSYTTPKTRKRIYAYDFGIKRNILNELVSAGMEVEVIPSDTPAYYVVKAYKEGAIDGVFLSNGPGDPLILREEKERISELLAARIPIFGICLGHQMLSIAHGYDTHKLKFGHHGGNHPVKDIKSGKVEITAQNHNYNVPEEISEVAEVTYRNLFDGTIEGVKYRGKPAMSVQHHPEASPGPHESSHIFREFRDML